LAVVLIAMLPMQAICSSTLIYDPAIEHDIALKYERTCAKQFSEFIVAPLQRAFVTSSGGCLFSSGQTSEKDAVDQALDRCIRRGSKECKTFATNSAVPEFGIKSSDDGKLSFATTVPESVHFDQSATGAVLWLHGSGITSEMVGAAGRHTPTFLFSLNARGWDLYALALDQDRSSPDQYIEKVRKTIVSLNLKYDKVVLGGYSLGAIAALSAANDASLSVTNILLVAPAAYDPRTGASALSFDEYMKLISGIRRTRVALVVFDADTISLPPRELIVKSSIVLKVHGDSYLMIGPEQESKGHDAIFGLPFALRYSKCLAVFFSEDADPGLNRCKN
jgi:pimeloyl-ACP methyl ester carboxylesterase